MNCNTIEIEVENAGKVETIAMPPSSSLGDLFQLMGLLREEFVALKRGRVVYEFDVLVPGDKIKLIRAFSGG